MEAFRPDGLNCRNGTNDFSCFCSGLPRVHITVKYVIVSNVRTLKIQISRCKRIIKCIFFFCIILPLDKDIGEVLKERLIKILVKY